MTEDLTVRARHQMETFGSGKMGGTDLKASVEVTGTCDLFNASYEGAVKAEAQVKERGGASDQTWLHGFTMQVGFSNC